MRCEEVRETLEACSTGELEASRAGEVERHMAACEVCRLEFVRLRQLAAFLRGTPVPPVPEGFAARVLSGAAEPERSLGALRWWRASSMPMRGAAALVLAAGLLAGGFMGRGAGKRGEIRRPVEDPLASHYDNFVSDVPESSPVRAYLSLTDGLAKEVRSP
jgi:anti-sigma factor RsiW